MLEGVKVLLLWGRLLEELVFRTTVLQEKEGERHHKWKSQLVPRPKGGRRPEGYSGLHLHHQKCGLSEPSSQPTFVGAENKVLGPGLRLGLGRVWERGKVAEQATKSGDSDLSSQSWSCMQPSPIPTLNWPPHSAA